MRLLLTFQKSNYVLIELFDEPLIQKWFDFFSSKKETYTMRNEYWCYHPHSYRDHIDVESCWNEILKSLINLENKGFKIPFQLSPTFDFQQSTLNFIHRFFTKNMIWIDSDPYHNLPNPFDCNFNIINDYDKQDFIKSIENLNNNVHSLEHVANLTENKIFTNTFYPITSFEIRPITWDNWLTFNSEDLLSNYKFFNYNQKNLVLLNRSILGKPPLQSFYENDDPTEIDCTGRFGSHGGFVFDTNENRKKLYSSMKFETWCKNFNLSPKNMPLEIVIGYVKKYTQPLELLVNRQHYFKGLEFIN